MSIFLAFRATQPGYNSGKIGLPGCPMKYRCLPALLLIVPLSFVSASSAGDQAPAATSAPKMSKQTRIELIRLLNAELVYVRSPFPMGRDGLKLRNGVVSPSGAELQQMVSLTGPAAKSGDAVRITNIFFRDNYVHVEINGGPVKKQKWYQRISVGGAGGSTPIAPTDSNANARGSFVNVYFDPYIPEMTGSDFKQMLRPVLDFDSKSKEEAYLETVPPKAKEAIQNHQVLVGMNVEFVRFIGDEVVRLERMKVDGAKEIRTEKEISLEPVTKVAQQQDDSARPANAPTLHRPGEGSDSPVAPGAAPKTPGSIHVPDPGTTSPPNFRPYLSQNLAAPGTRL